MNIQYTFNFLSCNFEQNLSRSASLVLDLPHPHLSLTFIMSSSAPLHQLCSHLPLTPSTAPHLTLAGAPCLPRACPLACPLLSSCPHLPHYLPLMHAPLLAPVSYLTYAVTSVMSPCMPVPSPALSLTSSCSASPRLPLTSESAMPSSASSLAP